MDIIKILEKDRRLSNRKNWYSIMVIQKYLVERSFDWLELYIDVKNKKLFGKGVLLVNERKYDIVLTYSVFDQIRYDKIYINDKKIDFDRNIHLYRDLSLCLYHPILDQSYCNKISLKQLIPWISEWIVFYELWKIYGIWLGNEHKH
ncbi:hypothetical protein [Myroides odoratimimus]|uniref:hypothetical protein n=1 Tax=Myroides odoratimimus TaxID=76832 RepID=UPI002DB78CCB|nr:hypothetical protein [Myroides odoratimimus]MEC4094168.1 hypothetical protein [Myroides odoratimimus]